MDEAKKADLLHRLDIIIRMATECKQLIEDDHKVPYNDTLNSTRFSLGIEITHFDKALYPILRIEPKKL
jgi:hypothetical protein